MLRRRPVAPVALILISLIISASACGEPAPANDTGATTEATPPAFPYPYPSHPTQEPLDPTEWKLTEIEAISVASGYVPSELAAHVKVIANREVYGNYQTGERHIAWYVGYMDFLVSREWLGWQDDPRTKLVGEGPYNLIAVSLDGITGELLRRTARFETPNGMAGETLPPTPVPWTPAASDDAS